MEKRKVVIVSGYFNPIHKGHLELFKKSQEHGDFLIVIVNSDKQRKLKGSLEFMDENERLMIVQAIKYVGHAFISIDQDRTQIESLKYLHKQFGSNGDTSSAYFGRTVCDK